MGEESWEPWEEERVTESIRGYGVAISGVSGLLLRIALFGPAGKQLRDQIIADHTAAARLQEAEAALRPFADFMNWMNALVELREVDPLKDHETVVQLSGGGGSNALHVAEFRRARAYFSQPIEEGQQR